MNESKIGQKFELMEDRFLVRGMAHQKRFHEKQELACVLERAVAQSQLQVVGYVDNRSQIRQIPECGFAGFIPDDPKTTIMIALKEGDISFNWFPEHCLDDKWGENLSVTVSLGVFKSLFHAVDVLSVFVNECDLFWGEANECSLTKRPTFCGPNAHYLEVPKIGMVNYFGAEYVRYFGGEDRFTSAPHVSTSSVSGGVMTVLDECSDTTDFEKKQSAVMAHLGNELFEVGDGGLAIHQRLFWDKDNVSNVAEHADAVWHRIEQAGKGIK